MIRKSIYEYLVGWRVNRGFEKPNIFTYCIWIYTFFIWSVTSKNKPGDITIYLLILFLIASMAKHPLALKKMDYLVPRTNSERQSYLKRLWICQGIIHSIVFMCIIAINYYYSSYTNAYLLVYAIIAGLMLCWIPFIQPVVNVMGIVADTLILLTIFANSMVNIIRLDEFVYRWIGFVYVFLAVVILPLFVMSIKHTRKHIIEISDIRGEANVKN